MAPDAVPESVFDFLQSPVARIILWAGLAAVMIAVGVYVIGKVRANLRNEETPSNDFITNFRELHERGELSDEEFRKIKLQLADRLQNELNDSGKSS